MKLLAEKGHPAIQNLQPMHRCMSIMTMPSSLWKVAWVGHTRTHGGFWQ